MNEITENEVNPAQLKILKKAGYSYYEQLARLKPKKLYDCRKEIILNNEAVGKNGMIIGTMTSLTSRIASSGMKITEAVVSSETNRRFVNIVWFHDTYIKDRYENAIGKRVMVFGKISKTYMDTGYQITAPIIFTDYPQMYEGKIIPANKKYKGLSAEYLAQIINAAATMPLQEPFSDRFRQENGLMSITELSESLHSLTDDQHQIARGFRQVDIEDLIYLSLNLNKQITNNKEKYPTISKCEVFNRAISELPFELTDGQKEALYGLREHLMDKSEVNALVQGDVSCGKSIVAYLLLLLLAENGYQGALLAPTVVLASQHYEDALSFFEKYGFSVAFVHGSLKKKEREAIKNGLKDNKINILVGTQAAVSDDIEFDKLGLAIIDEEQRFGVTCREKIKTKSTDPIYYVTMSATPIPRTLATCLYGEGTGIYSIKSLPSGRQSVDTILTDSFNVPEILKTELRNGRQAYVVCALITEDNKDDDSDKPPIVSVEKTLAKYKAAFPQYNIEALSGKTKDKDTLRIMQDFKDGKINILISTTVIEVGVNNPNASVIVIQNAERFGLSTLHQLRGRVRRGSYKPYCILMSAQKSERLKALVETDNGFELANKDLELRHSGNLIGTEQSGKNKFVELAISKPAIFELAKKMASQLRLYGEDQTFLDFYEYLDF